MIQFGALGLAIGVFVFFVWKASGFLVDDSFIYFRYAENIASGNGFVFNPGDAAGDGFTSWAWLFLLSLSHAFGWELTLASKILGIVFLNMSVGLTFLTARCLGGRHREGQWTAYCVACLLFLQFPLIAHSLSGMETALYVFSLALFIYLFTLVWSEDSLDLKRWVFFISSINLLFFTRPEGIVAGGVAFVALWFKHKRTLFQPKIAVAALFGLFLPVGLFLIWKLEKFGSLFPLPFFHKFVGPYESVHISLKHTAYFFESYGWLFVLGFISMIYAFFFLREKIYLMYTFLFLLMILLYLPFMPIMNYLDRFYIPYLTLVLLLLIPGFRFLFDFTKRFKTAGGRTMAGFLLFLLLFAGLNSRYSSTLTEVRFWQNMTDPSMNRAELGVRMSYLPTDIVVANTEMGVIPFYSGLTCLDMAGLTDPVIAKQGLSMDYLLKRGTDLILFPMDVSILNDEWYRQSGRGYEAVFRSKSFREGFEYLGFYAAWPQQKSGYYFYLNRESEKIDTIRAWGLTYLEDK